MGVSHTVTGSYTTLTVTYTDVCRLTMFVLVSLNGLQSGTYGAQSIRGDRFVRVSITASTQFHILDIYLSDDVMV